MIKIKFNQNNIQGHINLLNLFYEKICIGFDHDNELNKNKFQMKQHHFFFYIGLNNNIFLLSKRNADSKDFI